MQHLPEPGDSNMREIAHEMKLNCPPAFPSFVVLSVISSLYSKFQQQQH